MVIVLLEYIDFSLKCSLTVKDTVYVQIFEGRKFHHPRNLNPRNFIKQLC